MRIGFTYDLKDFYINKGMSKEEAAEFDEKITINSIKKELESLNYEIDDIGNLDNFLKKISDGEKWDIIFNIAEGVNGYSRESVIPSILENYNIKHTFSDSNILTLCLDKYLTKIFLEKSNIKTPKFELISKIEDINNIKKLNFPLFIKPVNEGTGKGINKNSKVLNFQELIKQTEYLFNNYTGPFLLEEYIEGKEITIGLTKNMCFGIVELEFKNTHNFYCYDNKKDYEKLVVHHKIDENTDLYKNIYNTSKEVFDKLNLKDIARIDIRVDNKTNEVYVIEINPIPGLNPIDSELPILAYKNGYTYKDIIKTIIEETIKRES